MNAKVLSSCLAALVTVHSAWAKPGEIRSWRNGGNGLYPGATAATDWKDAGGILWETPLGARGNGCAILVGGRLFFTAEPSMLMCVDAKTGGVLWEKSNEYADLMELTPAARKEMEAEREASKENEGAIAGLERDLYRAERRLRRTPHDSELLSQVDRLKKEIAGLQEKSAGSAAAMKKPPAHDVNGYSSYTPVSDGKHVWVCFGTGVVVCYDLEGRRLWHKRLDAPDHAWGGACSPTLVDGRLIVRFSDYVALDPATGGEVWRTPSGGVVFNCPANFELDGRYYLYTARGELLRAADGKKLPSQDYEVNAKPWCFFNTPSVIGNRVYAAHGCEGEQGDAYALEIPDSAEKLEKDGLKQVWHRTVSKNRYYSSPLVHEGIVYLINREYQMQALDAASGEEIYSERVRGFTGTAYPSLTLAGEVIFVGAEDGNAAFVKPGRAYQEIARTKVDPYRSTPIFNGGTCYLRTHEKLRAISAR
jgi:outer membrane protein assembly factor BamB